MSENFKPFSFEITGVRSAGKDIKKKYCWKFELNKENFNVELTFSRGNAKRTVAINGVKQYSATSSGFGSVYQLKIPGNTVFIYEVTTSKFELSVNKHLFSKIQQIEAESVSFPKMKLPDSKNYDILKYDKKKLCLSDRPFYCGYDNEKMISKETFDTELQMQVLQIKNIENKIRNAHSISHQNLNLKNSAPLLGDCCNNRIID